MSALGTLDHPPRVSVFGVAWRNSMSFSMEPIEHILSSRSVRYVTCSNWLGLDRIEVIRFQVADRPRVKSTSR